MPGCHGHAAQRGEVEVEHEVAVAALPRGHRVAVDGVHVDVDGEQVVAALGAVVEHSSRKNWRVEPLALQPALHVGEGARRRCRPCPPRCRRPARSRVSIGGAVIALLVSVPRISLVEDLVGGLLPCPFGTSRMNWCRPRANQNPGEPQHGEHGDRRVVERVAGDRR